MLCLMKRRGFLQTGLSTTLGFGAGLTILADASSVWGAAANEKIGMALTVLVAAVLVTIAMIDGCSPI